MYYRSTRYARHDAKSFSDRPASENGDCVVQALAAVSGRPYTQAHEYAADVLGRRFGKGTLRSAQVREFDASQDVPVLGCTFTRVFGEGKHGNVRSGRITLRNFISMFPRGTFYVIHSGHAFALVDGVVRSAGPMKLGALIQIAWRVEEVQSQVTHHPSQLRALMLAGMSAEDAGRVTGAGIGKAVAEWNAIPFALRKALGDGCKWPAPAGGYGDLS